MKRKIIIISALVAMAMLLAALAGCRSESETPAVLPQEDAQTPATTPATPADTPADPVETTPDYWLPGFNPTGFPIMDELTTITVMGNMQLFQGNYEDLEMMQMLEEITNIRLEPLRLEGEQIDVFLAAGEITDFIYSGLWGSDIRRFQQFGAAGMFADWTPLLGYMPHLSEIFDETPFMRTLVTELNGHIYALPMKNRASTSVETRLKVRTDYLEMLGLDMPNTVDEFEHVLRMAMEYDLTSGHAPLIAFDFGAFNSRMEPFFFAAFGPSVDPGWTADANGAVSFNRVSEQYREFLRFFHRLHSDGLFENEYLTMDRQTANARDRAGFSMFNTEFTTIVPEDFPGGEMALTQVPPLTSQWNDVRHTRAGNIYRIGGGAINTNADPGLMPVMARFFDLWFSREDIAGDSGIEAGSFIYGLRGRDWDVIGDELILNIPEGISLSHGNFVNTYVKLNHAFGYWNDLAMGGTPNALARQIGYVTNNIPYQVPFFPIVEMKYTAEEMDIINMFGVDVDLFAREARARFIAGVDCIENDWDRYVATIQGMGLAQLQEVYQTAFDRWTAILAAAGR